MWKFRLVRTSFRIFFVIKMFLAHVSWLKIYQTYWSHISWQLLFWYTIFRWFMLNIVAISIEVKNTSFPIKLSINNDYYTGKISKCWIDILLMTQKVYAAWIKLKNCFVINWHKSVIYSRFITIISITIRHSFWGIR